MSEAQRQLIGQEAGDTQLLRGGPRLIFPKPGERGGVPQLTRLQYGDRIGKLASVLTQPSQARNDTIAQALCPERLQALSRLSRGAQSILAGGPQQLPNEQRITRRRFMATSRELAVGLAKLADRQLAHPLSAQRRRPQHILSRDRPQLRERVIRGGGLAAAPGHQQQQRHVLDSPRQVREPAQRGTVHPLQIINDQHQRLMLRQRTGQRH